MKSLFIALFLLINIGITETVQENSTIEATFDGYEKGAYYFTDENEESYEFSEIDQKVLEKIDLSQEKHIGKKFKVTYISVFIDSEEDDDEEIYTVINIEPIK